MAGTPLLDVRAVSRRFGGITAVNGVDLAVHDGEIVGLIGPNGAGKTTLFNVITGFLRPSSGSVRFRGQELCGVAPHRLGQLGVVRTFQRTAIFGAVTVLQAVRMGSHRTTRAGVFDAIFRTPRHHREERETTSRARQILEIVGLDAYANEIAGTLSYGQQRLVEVAIALAAQPALLLLDEPAAGLNPTESAALTDVLLEVRKRGTAILLVEHDMSVVMTLCENIVVMASGNKIAEGAPDEIRRNDLVIGAYLGAADAYA